MLYLNQNEYRYPHSPLCLDALKNFSPQWLSEYAVKPPLLLNAIAQFFQVDVNRVISAFGAEDILKQSFAMLLNKETSVLLPRYGWYYYQELAHEMGANIIFYDFIDTDDGFVLDTSQVQALLKTHKPKIFLLNSPANPTGSIVTKTQIDLLLNDLPAETLMMFDEAYWGFYEPDYNFHDLYKNPNVMVLRTFSKFFGLTGLRAGFAFVGDNWMPVKQRLSRYLGTTNFADKIVMACLDSVDYYKGIVEQINIEKQKYIDTLTPLGVRIHPSFTNFVLVRVKDDEFEKLKTKCAEKEIVIKFFDEGKEPQFKNCIRISIGLPQENDQVIAVFRDTLKG